MALLIAQKYKKNITSPINLKDLAVCLKKLAQFATTVNASVHLPRLGATTPSFNWYNTERYIRKELCGRQVPTYIYYFKRGVTPKTPVLVTPRKFTSPKRIQINSPPSSPIGTLLVDVPRRNPTTDDDLITQYNVTSPLPNYFTGLKLAVTMKDLGKQELISRHIVAYGGIICNQNGDPSLIIGTSNNPKIPSITSAFITDSVTQKTQLDYTDYMS